VTGSVYSSSSDKYANVLRISEVQKKIVDTTEEESEESFRILGTFSGTLMLGCDGTLRLEFKREDTSVHRLYFLLVRADSAILTISANHCPVTHFENPASRYGNLSGATSHSEEEERALFKIRTPR